MKAWALAALVAAGVLVGPSQPASAAEWSWTAPKPQTGHGRTVEVVNKLSGWEVRSAVGYVDRYTASRVRYVSRCSATAWKCVTIRSGRVSGKSTGWSQGRTITIDKDKAKRYGFAKSAAFRKYLVAHEFAHQMGLHHTSGRNLMNPNAKCRGKWIPLVLNSSQRKALANR